MYNYSAKIIRVVDGDTIDALIDVGFGITVNQRLRILNLDTPEKFRPSCESEKMHGEAATAFAKELLCNQSVMINTQKDKKGKYGRLLASITLNDGSDFATVMLKEGFSKKEDYK